MNFYRQISLNQFIGTLLIAILVFSGTGYADERQTWRAWAGLDIFPSILAADQDIRQKLDPDHQLCLVLVYRRQGEVAHEMADHLAKIKKIRNMDIKVITVSVSHFLKEDVPRAAGVFFVEPLTSSQRTAITHYGIKRGTIIFSSFEGDVENGVTGGILISDRILPYINLATMRRSGIRLKPFFLRIAEQYD